MVYFLEISDEAKEQIASLDKVVGERVKRKIDQLIERPTLGESVGRSSKLSAMVFEIRIFSPVIRIYYIIRRGTIVIQSVEYEGKVRVEKVGDKRSQRRDIRDLM